MRALAVFLVVAVPSVGLAQHKTVLVDPAMVPCASLAHGLGPADDAPRAVQAPSARLLPSAAPLQEAAVTAPVAPLYKSWVLWTALGALTAAVAAVVIGVVVASSR